MDKLKQVLKYQFWILLGVALILPFVGWTLATSGFVSEAEARSKSLADLDGSLKMDANDPNKEWESGLEAINVKQADQPKIAAKVLYERQLPLMTWPSKMPNDPANFQTKHQEYYRTAYRQMVEAVRKVVKPYDDETQAGVVFYGEELLPTPDLTEWVSQAPSIEQIKAAQEDLWLLAAILKQIAAVNDDEEARTPFDAAIRQINELYLRGGSKAAGAAKSTSTNSGPQAGGLTGIKGMDGMNMGGSSKSMPGAGGIGGRNEGAAAIASPKISPDEDLGPEQSAADDKATSSKAAAKGPMSAAASGTSTLGMGSSSGMGGSSSSSSRWSPSNMGRYRDDKPEFRTRGFYLEVVMDHRRIPELLAALANADWPINVLRVQESDFRDEDLADAGGAGLGGMGSSRSMGSMPAPPGGGRSGGGGPPGLGGAAPGLKGASGRSGDDSGEGPVNNRSPFDDPNLANVAIVGVIYIFKKPDEKALVTSPGSPAPSVAPAASPLATAPAAAAPGTPAADASKTAPVASETASETADDDDAKTDPAAATPDNKPESNPENKEAGAPVKPVPEKAEKS